MKKMFKKMFNFLFLLILLLSSCKVDVPIRKVTITYQSDFAVPSSLEVEMGKPLSSQELPELQTIGYKFNGWFIGDDKIRPGYVVNNNITLIAAWSPIEYSIIYALNEGSFIDGYKAPDKYNCENSKYVELPTKGLIQKEGFLFDGWYTDPNFATAKVEKLEDKATGNLVLFAKWKKLPAVTYTISFDNNGKGGTKEEIKYLELDSTVTLPTYPDDEVVGYHFDGWYTDKECSEVNKATSPYTVKGNQTLYAKWGLNKYTITYFKNGGQWITSDYENNLQHEFTIESSHTIVFPTHEHIKQSEYKFLGWYDETDAEKTIIHSLEKNRAQDIELIAKWELLPRVAPIEISPKPGDYDKDDAKGYYEVTLSCDTPNAQIYYTFDTTPPSLSNGKPYNGTLYSGPIQIKKNFTFISAVAIKEGMSHSTLRMDNKAYGIKEYKAHFHANNRPGGDASDITEKGIRNTVVTLPQLSSNGYTFAGWYKDQECSEGNEVSGSTITLTKDENFYAKWTPLESQYGVSLYYQTDSYEYHSSSDEYKKCIGLNGTIPTFEDMAKQFKIRPGYMLDTNKTVIDKPITPLINGMYPAIYDVYLAKADYKLYINILGLTNQATDPYPTFGEQKLPTVCLQQSGSWYRQSINEKDKSKNIGFVYYKDGTKKHILNLYSKDGSVDQDWGEIVTFDSLVKKFGNGQKDIVINIKNSDQIKIKENLGGTGKCYIPDSCITTEVPPLFVSIKSSLSDNGFDIQNSDTINVIPETGYIYAVDKLGKNLKITIDGSEGARFNLQDKDGKTIPVTVTNEATNESMSFNIKVKNSITINVTTLPNLLINNQNVSSKERVLCYLEGFTPDGTPYHQMQKEEGTNNYKMRYYCDEYPSTPLHYQIVAPYGSYDLLLVKDAFKEFPMEIEDDPYEKYDQKTLLDSLCVTSSPLSASNKEINIVMNDNMNIIQTSTPYRSPLEGYGNLALSHAFGKYGQNYLFNYCQWSFNDPAVPAVPKPVITYTKDGKDINTDNINVYLDETSSLDMSVTNEQELTQNGYTVSYEWLTTSVEKASDSNYYRWAYNGTKDKSYKINSASEENSERIIGKVTVRKEGKVNVIYTKPVNLLVSSVFYLHSPLFLGGKEMSLPDELKMDNYSLSRIGESSWYRTFIDTRSFTGNETFTFKHGYTTNRYFSEQYNIKTNKNLVLDAGDSNLTISDKTNKIELNDKSKLSNYVPKVLIDGYNYDVKNGQTVRFKVYDVNGKEIKENVSIHEESSNSVIDDVWPYEYSATTDGIKTFYCNLDPNYKWKINVTPSN